MKNLTNALFEGHSSVIRYNVPFLPALDVKEEGLARIERIGFAPFGSCLSPGGLQIKVTVKILMREASALLSHDALSNLKTFRVKRESCHNIRNLLMSFEFTSSEFLSLNL